MSENVDLAKFQVEVDTELKRILQIDWPPKFHLVKDVAVPGTDNLLVSDNVYLSLGTSFSFRPTSPGKAVKKTAQTVAKKSAKRKKKDGSEKGVKKKRKRSKRHVRKTLGNKETAPPISGAAWFASAQKIEAGGVPNGVTRKRRSLSKVTLSLLESKDIENEQKAKEIIARKDIRDYLCPALQTVSNDAFDISKVITPILVGLVVAGTISIPLVPVLVASMAFVIARMGISTICKDYKKESADKE